MNTAGAQFGREFNTARQQQGFRSQAHLDAFYAYRDHMASCQHGCGKPGSGVWVDDGFQPTVFECEEGQRLYRLSARIDR